MQLAEANLDPNGVNRVILATDGDFNVGITDQGELKGYIERERGKGVFLSRARLRHGQLQRRADADAGPERQRRRGLHRHASPEARKTLVEEAGSTLFPIAKDVKIQVEFNPRAVAEYRLIGYETRALNRDDFDNDKVDAGDVGSGQTVTALYEVVPVGGPADDGRPALRGRAKHRRAVPPAEFGFVKIRYKLPKSDTQPADLDPDRPPAEVRQLRRRAAATRASPPPSPASPSCCAAARYSGSLSYDDVLQDRHCGARPGRVRLPLGVRPAGARGQERPVDGGARALAAIGRSWPPALAPGAGGRPNDAFR